MPRFLLFLFIILNFCNCKSVINRKDNATIQLNELKTGILLVRLPTIKSKISKLKEMGKFAEAKKISTFNKQFHFDVIHSFAGNFHYCPVYFFYSNNTEDIKNGNINGNIFDQKRKKIKNLDTPLEQIFFAEFGQVHQQEMLIEQDGKKIKVAGIGGKDALVIRTHEGIQPLRPFPYSIDYKNVFNGNLNLAVRKLNKRLFKIHGKMKKRELRRKN